MSYLLTIDPGARYAAWALWNKGDGTLLEARQTPDARLLPNIADHVLGPVYEHLGGPPRVVHPVVHPLRVLVELPREYDEDKAERAKDLFLVAATAGALVMAFNLPHTTAEFVRPPEWKGQLPKPVHHQRAWAVLTGAEQGRVFATTKNRHNVLDAVAMGLWALRRLR